MGNFKRQTHGIRLNLTSLQNKIDELEQDKVEMMRLGYSKEARNIDNKLQDLYMMKTDATKHGYGYYDYKVTHTGRKLVLVVAGLLALAIACGWAWVVFA